MNTLKFDVVLEGVEETTGAVLEIATVGSIGRLKSHGYMGTVVDSDPMESSTKALVAETWADSRAGELVKTEEYQF